MRRALAIAAVLTLAFGAGMSQPAIAQAPVEVESRIVNVNGPLIQLSGGTVVQVPQALALQADLREGRAVKLKYEIKDGKNVATSIEFPEETPAGSRK
jgi:hypothetical protein